MTTTATRPARGARAAISAKTLRTDRWWLAPVLTVAGLSAWLIYGLVHILLQKDYFAEGAGYHYLTPFYSPCVNNGCVPAAAEFGRFVPDWPLVPYALLTLPFLLLFRLTCYYYRRAYYRSFWLSPPACAVPDAHERYTGETRFPLVFQNAHRYAFYAAVVISLINTWDAIISFDGTKGFGSRYEIHLCQHRAGQPHPGRQRGAAVGVHPVVPLVPAHHRRPAQALLPAPDPLPGVDLRLRPQHPAHAAGVGHAGHPGLDRPLYLAGLSQRVLRLALGQLRGVRR